MILKKSYWAKWLENNRRRSWTFLLCLVMALFCGPLYLMVVLTGLQNNYANDSVYNAAQAAESLRELIQSRITDVIGFSSIHVLFAAFFAILFAVQGFCWLYSRRKTDLYFSVPESLKKRYMLICGNGILVYSFSTLTALLLDWIIGAAFHGMTGIMAAQSLLAWFVEQLAFIAMYQVALVAVMLTGNILTALLGCAVFFSYELAVRFLIDELKTMFFASYCSADARQWMQKSYLTPFAGFWDLLNHIWYRDEGRLCSYKNAGGWGRAVGVECILLLACAAAAGLFAFWLYRRRKTESYEHAIAFAPLKGILEAAMAVPFGIAVGMIISRVAANKGLFLFGGCIVGVLVGHVVIRLIYRCELKTILDGKLAGIFSIAAAVLILAGFQFDWTGYDRWIPEKGNIAAVSVTMEDDYTAFGYYQGESFGSDDIMYEAFDDRMLRRMNSTEEKTIDAAIRMQKRWQDAGMPGSFREEEAQTEISAEEINPKEEKRYVRWVVCYTMESGRKVYRRFLADSNENHSEIDTVMRDASYQRERYQLNDPDFLANVGKMKVSYYNGVTESFYTGDKQTLLKTLQEEMKKYDYSLISSELPNGRLSFAMADPEEKDASMMTTWTYPVYGSYLALNDLLVQDGAEVYAHAGHQSADDIESIKVDYYYYDDDSEEENSDSFFEPGEIPDQEIQVTLSDPEDIEKMLDAIYPIELSWISGEEFGVYNWDYRIDVTVVPKESSYSNPDEQVRILKSQEPSLLAERIRQAAVRD